MSEPEVFYDSAGNELFERGILQWEADLYFHVCFDDFEWVGEMLHIYTAVRAKEVVRAKMALGEKPLAGSKGWGLSDTGRGYKATLHALAARSFVISERYSGRKVGEAGKCVAMRFLQAFGCTFREATLQEEKENGFDLVVISGLPEHSIMPMRDGTKIEVKARGVNKAYPEVFLQTHEINTEKVYT
jgi:hypothetical protein